VDFDPEPLAVDTNADFVDTPARTHVDRAQKNPPFPAGFERADARTRTGDPFITSEVLYQLSYVGRSETV
jgi:hypothetical protein